MLFHLSGRWRGAGALTTAILGVWLFTSPAALAGQGAVTGTVTTGAAMRPLAGAQVFVQGTEIGTQTAVDGTYRLEGVSAGTQTISVQFLGYRSATQEVTVASGQVVTADFALEMTALALDELVVTGVVGETSRIKLPFTVEKLTTEDMPVPASDVSNLLKGKAAGVQVTSTSGQPGQAASITLRGPTSINASGRGQGPLIVIDGIISSGTLSDIGSLDIESVELVKGAAAASLYGSRAQNGVIQIATRRGTELTTNSINIRARGEYGYGQLAGDIGLVRQHPYKMNDAGTKFIDTSGNEIDFRDLNRPGFGSAILQNQIDPSAPGTPQTAFANQEFPGELFDHMDTFFDPGETMDLYAAVTGRFGESSFRVSVSDFTEAGVVRCSACADNLATLNADRVSQGLNAFDVDLPDDEGFRRQNVRVNVDTRFGDLDIAASSFFSRSDQDDRAVSTGAFSRLTFMSPAVDLAGVSPLDGRPDVDADPQSIEENPLYLLSVNDSRDERTRTMGSVDFNYALPNVPWLSAQVNASFDRTQFSDYTLRPKNERSAGTGPRDFTGGSLRKFSSRRESINASAKLNANQTLMDGDLLVRAQAQYLIEDEQFESHGVSGSGFSVDGVPTFGAIEGDHTGSNSQTAEKAQSVYLIGGIDYKDRYILDGLIRRDGSSLFGPEERWQTYYRGSIAWRVAQEDWWTIDAINELKLRFSLGTAGGRPTFSAQYETFGVSAGAIFPINLGNKFLKPEFTTEQEAGLNLVFLNNLAVDLTYAWQTTDDQLLGVPQPAFVGYSSQWRNAGEIFSETYEASLTYSAIDTEDLGLNLRFNWDRTQQHITRLDIPAFTTGNFYVAEGRPLGELWGEVWARDCADLMPVGISASDCASNFQVNDDGLLVPTGGAAYTEGFSAGLWGTQVAVMGDGGERSYHWGLPVKVQDYSPACMDKYPGEYMEKCPLTEFLPFGQTTPDFNFSFGTNFRYQSLTLNGLVEASMGPDIYNGTQQWALRELRGEDVDQTGKPMELHKPVGYASAIYSVNADNDWFKEDGTWIKLREISLGYAIPSDFTSSLFGGVFDQIQLSVIGRNLLTITDYRGYDPEVGFTGGTFSNAVLNRVDSFGYPNFRTFTFAAEFVF